MAMNYGLGRTNSTFGGIYGAAAKRNIAPVARGVNSIFRKPGAAGALVAPMQRLLQPRAMASVLGSKFAPHAMASVLGTKFPPRRPGAMASVLQRLAGARGNPMAGRLR